MDEILNHINPTNTLNLVNLYQGTRIYSEVIRKLYLAIRKAVELQADTFCVTAQTISATKDGKTVMLIQIALFESRFRTTFRQRMLDILRFDTVIANHVCIEKSSEDEVICKLENCL